MFREEASWLRKSVVCLSILIFFSGCSYLLEDLAKRAPLLFLFSSAILCALYGGLAMGIIAALIAATIHNYLFQFPKFSMGVSSSEDLFELGFFLIMAVLVSYAGSVLRKAQKEAELSRKRTEEAIQARDELLATVTHDLKNPLAAIQMSTAVIRKNEKVSGTSPLSKSLDMIEHTTDRMLRLISNLLDYEKVRNGKIDIDLKSHPVRSIFEEVREMMLPLIEKKSQRIAFNFPPDSTTVTCDPDRIVQVFSNLIGNASKFTSVGGAIEVGYHLMNQPENPVIEFFVKDTGPGIPDEQLSHVFDRYWQARHTARQGTGLGLSIVKGIVEGHHGKIRVESTLGQGSTFFFSLPQ